ncbi:hypothetical protein BB560_002669 [Smittium megazygosporum]|nr:hypothetical protein BB560_002669 [Smittium megazygosporum]
MQPNEVTQFLSRLKQTLIDIENLNIPTIAAIDGAALGGGLELALSCDIRVSGPNSVVGLPETGLGIIPGAGGTQRLVNLVGISKAKELVFTGQRLKPEEALKYGIFNKASFAESNNPLGTNDSNLKSGYDLAFEMAAIVSTKGPIAIQMAKKAINLGASASVAEGLEIEQLCYNRVIATEDRLEGLKAFKEKRQPVYKGK